MTVLDNSLVSTVYEQADVSHRFLESCWLSWYGYEQVRSGGIDAIAYRHVKVLHALDESSGLVKQDVMSG